MPSAPPTKVHAFLRTDVGMVREHNEDSAYADPAGMFFIVADGMGGHAAGEVASAMAVDAVRSALEAARDRVEAFIRRPSEDGRRALVQVLEEAVRSAHAAVFERGGRETDKKGMGTTLDVLLVADGEAFVAHVGDSRTYLVRAGAAAPVTTDHTVAEVLVMEGKLTPEEARLSPLRTILVNAIGVSAEVGVELAHLRLRREDKILLCSDGLHDYFPSDGELGEMLREQGGDEGLVRLVELAKTRGGHDNITGVLVEVVEGYPTVEEEEAARQESAGGANAPWQVDTLPIPRVDPDDDGGASADGAEQPALAETAPDDAVPRPVHDGTDVTKPLGRAGELAPRPGTAPGDGPQATAKDQLKD